MEGIIGEVRLFAGNFAPQNWAFCQGQLITISSNQALFAILGTIYGGDGQNNFRLPDLRGRVVIGAGQGPGLTERFEGQTAGQADYILTNDTMPAHSHSAIVHASSANPETNNPTDAYPAVSWLTPGNHPIDVTISAYGTTKSPDTDMAVTMVTLGDTGNNESVNNMQPSIVTNYIICLMGEFPSRG